MSAQGATDNLEPEHVCTAEEDAVKADALFLIGPPGQLRKALENKGYLDVDVFDQGDRVIAEFDCSTAFAEAQWFLENAGNNCRLYLIGCSYLYRSAGEPVRITANFSYDRDKTVQRVPVQRPR